MVVTRRRPSSHDRLSPRLCRVILDHLGLAVFVFRNMQLEYTNAAARRLVARVRARYHVEFLVALSDHLSRIGSLSTPGRRPVVTMLTASGGEPFHMHVVPLTRGALAVTVREVGADVASFRDQYKLSRRETEVAELVAHGYRNRDIALALGIAPETTKKHLKRVFDKVGVDSRVQLANRLV